MRLWRNNSGSLPDPRTGRYVQFGVGSPGGSDLIGYRKVTVTEAMVGQEIAQFAAVEVKTPRGRVKSEQQQFIDHVLSAGGVAGVARSVDEVDVSIALPPAAARHLQETPVLRDCWIDQQRCGSALPAAVQC